MYAPLCVTRYDPCMLPLCVGARDCCVFPLCIEAYDESTPSCIQAYDSCWKVSMHACCGMVP